MLSSRSQSREAFGGRVGDRLAKGIRMTTAETVELRHPRDADRHQAIRGWFVRSEPRGSFWSARHRGGTDARVNGCSCQRRTASGGGTGALPTNPARLIALSFAGALAGCARRRGGAGRGCGPEKPAHPASPRRAPFALGESDCVPMPTAADIFPFADSARVLRTNFSHGQLSDLMVESATHWSRSAAITLIS